MSEPAALEEHEHLEPDARKVVEYVIVCGLALAAAAAAFLVWEMWAANRRALDEQGTVIPFGPQEHPQPEAAPDMGSANGALGDPPSGAGPSNRPGRARRQAGPESE